MSDSNKYQNGKIYKIHSLQTDKIYVGSTTEKYLSNRLSGHNTQFKKPEKYYYCTSFELLKYDDAQIILIENWPCKSKDELRQREEYWREHFKDICVNKNACYRNEEYQKQYWHDYYQKRYQDENYRQQMRENKRKWRKNNKEHYKMKAREYDKNRRDRKQKIVCSTCGSVIYDYKYGKHTHSLKHQKQIKLKDSIKKTDEDYKNLINLLKY